MDLSRTVTWDFFLGQSYYLKTRNENIAFRLSLCVSLFFLNRLTNEQRKNLREKKNQQKIK